MGCNCYSYFRTWILHRIFVHQTNKYTVPDWKTTQDKISDENIAKYIGHVQEVFIY
jgi:hypothetical protein